MGNNHTPKIRFQGYICGWEERKIGEFLTESRISGSNGLEAKKLTVKLWGKGVVPKNEIYQGSEATKYYIRKAGQFIYGKLDFLHQAFGIIPDRLDGYESTLDSPAFDIAANLNSSFFLEYVSRKQFYLYQGTIANGSRKAKRIHSETFLEMPLIVPEMEEQEKISSFFGKIDRTIALHQKELTILKQTKHGLLQKMFPKEGESVPEIRFPGFHKDWEQCKLGQISDVTKLAGFEFTKYVIYTDEGKIIALRGLNVKNRTLVLDDVKYIDQSDFSKLNRSKLFKNDILFTYVGTVGELAVVPENDKYYLAPNVARIRLNDNVNPQFVSQMMGNKMFYDKVIFPLIATSSQPALSMENVRKFTLKLPSIEEQTKIGQFFFEFDSLITIHQKELELLLETKKVFLQKMFV